MDLNENREAQLERHVTNEDMLKTVEEKRQPINLIREFQARRIGCVMCSESLFKKNS